MNDSQRPEGGDEPLLSPKRLGESAKTSDQANRAQSASPTSPATSATSSSTSAACSPASTSPRPPPRTEARSRTVTSAPGNVRTGFKMPQNTDEYRSFLRQNHTIVRLAEDVLSRLILYAPSRFSHSSRDDIIYSSRGAGGGGRTGGVISALLNAESLYALLNLWTLGNDVILDGTGDGGGMTIGTASEAEELRLDLDSIGAEGAEKAEAETALNKDWGEVAVFDQDASSSVSVSTILQSLPSGITNLLSNPQRLIIGLRAVLSALECIAPAMEVLSGIPTSTSGPVHVQRQAMARAELTKMTVLTRVERIKFMCRLCLLAVDFTGAYKRMRADEEEDGQGVVCASIMSHGGMLHPGERGIPSALEEERMRRISYVGRRTGRRAYPGGRDGASRHSAQATASPEASPKMKLLALAAGELLHVYRPLYWTAAERDHAAHGVHSQCCGDSRSTSRFHLLKAWIISLAMDVISHKLTLVAGGDTTIGIGLQQPDHNTKLPPATVDELRRRRMRWMLYLLRCPVWDVVTKPVAGGLTEMVGRFVPLLGRPLANYVMELLIYWQRHHFMLEG